MAYISLGMDIVMKPTADLIHVRSQTGGLSVSSQVYFEECGYISVAITHILLKNKLLSGRGGDAILEAQRGHIPCRQSSRQCLQLT